MHSERVEEILPSIRGLIDYIWDNKEDLESKLGLYVSSRASICLDADGVFILGIGTVFYEDIIKWMKEREGEQA